MEKQIREVIFSNGTATKTVAGFYQWSHGQVLRIKGLMLPAAVEVHFALRRSGEAIRRIGVTKDGVTEVEIPDTLFRTMITSDYDAYAYIYISDEEYGTTTHEIVMKIKSRPMPEDEKDTFENILKSVNAIADGKVNIEQGEGNNGKYLGIVDGKVVLVDAPEGTSGTSSAVQYVEQILTETQKTQARSNIGAASKAEVSELSATIADKATVENGVVKVWKSATEEGGTDILLYTIDLSTLNTGGINSTARALFISILRNGIFSTDQSANITALEIALESSGSGSEGDSGENEVTLTSISATYTGGDVEVGTVVTDLAGIVVTAHYSDGSTETVTDYTLSGTIAEGSNVVTVVYGGKATTFTVTGIAEAVKYGLHQVMGYTGECAFTGFKGKDVSAIEITADIKSGVTNGDNTYVLLSTYIHWVGFQFVGLANEKSSNCTFDKSSSEILDMGKTTFTLSAFSDSWKASGENIKTAFNNSGVYSPEAIWYNFKFFDVDGNMIADIKPTGTLGELFDSVTGAAFTYSDTEGLSLVEVTN